MLSVKRLKERWFSVVLILVSGIATGSSLYFSEVMGFIPCELCWYQRILMYPLFVIGVMSLVRKQVDLELWKYVLPLSTLGMVIAGYHVYIQENADSGATTCMGGVSCTAKYFEVWGFADIPFFSLIAFVMINGLVIGYTIWSKKRAKTEA